MIVLSLRLEAQNTVSNVYIISGQGSDERIFSEIDWDSSRHKVQYIPYLIPECGETMNHYARRMAQTIDTSQAFALVGVSLGGMICSEMTTFLHPHKTILISSAKCRQELPLRYRIQRHLPFYALVPKAWLKAGAQIAQPLFEPDRRSHKTIFKSMLRAKDKRFTKRSIRMIINWKKKEYDSRIIHIHGNNDHTLPIRNISATRIVENGSHMMTLTRAQEISGILREYL